jgi:hypothetical protein
LNIEGKVWLLVKNYWLTKTDRMTKTSPLAGIWRFQWEKITHFACFGEPCMVYQFVLALWLHLTTKLRIQKIFVTIYIYIYWLAGQSTIFCIYENTIYSLNHKNWCIHAFKWIYSVCFITSFICIIYSLFC